MSGERTPAPGTVAVVTMMRRRANVALFDGRFWRSFDTEGPVKCVPAAITSIETPYIHDGRMSGWIECATPGCPGDMRYAAPGRGHIPGCTSPVTASDARPEVDRVAGLLMAEWERVEGKPVNVSYVATFADMARVVIADREAQAEEVRVSTAAFWAEVREAGEAPK